MEGEWTLMVVGAGVSTPAEAVEADGEKLMLRSTGVAAEAACMVYLAISRLQTVETGGGEVREKMGETKGKGKQERGVRKKRQ